jgi:hypothetical protein
LPEGQQRLTNIFMSAIGQQTPPKVANSITLAKASG